MMHFDFMVCPVKEITMYWFSFPKCDSTDLTNFHTFNYELPLLGTYSFSLRKLHIHSIALGLFASLLAPLGGLFASGFKRAIKIKDFAATIPGHGGLTDRMDCQILMVII
jgi:phosphatidate cytidylyltransferase